MIVRLLYKVHSHCAGKSSVVEAVSYVTPVVWQASSDIVVHAATGA